jgi:CDP-diacylglycerol--glycerol-3-phosphate 3-phosphatidyltransferase
VTSVSRVPVWNLANGLTVLRLALIPVFVIFAITSQLTDPALRIGACVSFGLASLTDLADGWIARKWQLVTSFGKVADPIADKALTGTALVLLSAYGRLPWWITIIILVREIGVTALRFWVIRTEVIAASRGGKVKTVLQILAIGWYLLPLPPAIGGWIMGVALVVTVATGVDYVVTVIRKRRATAAVRR